MLVYQRVYLFYIFSVMNLEVELGLYQMLGAFGSWKVTLDWRWSFFRTKDEEAKVTPPASPLRFAHPSCPNLAQAEVEGQIMVIIMEQRLFWWRSLFVSVDVADIQCALLLTRTLWKMHTAYRSPQTRHESWTLLWPPRNALRPEPGTQGGHQHHYHHPHPHPRFHMCS